MHLSAGSVRGCACRSAVACVFVGLLASLLSGCVPVRIPPAGHQHASRVALPDRVPEFIAIGRTTREELLAALGEPDGVGAEGHWWAYSSLVDDGGVAWVAPLPNLPFGAEVTLVERQLVIWFDASTIVSNVTLKIARCPAVSADFRSLERLACLPLGDEDYAVAELPWAHPLARFEQVHFATPLGRTLPGQPTHTRRAFQGVIALTERSLNMEAVRSLSLDHPALPKLRIPYPSITALRERVDAISGRQTFLEIETRAGMTYEVLIRTPTPAWQPFGRMASSQELEALVTQLQERSGLPVSRAK